MLCDGKIAKLLFWAHESTKRKTDFQSLERGGLVLNIEVSALDARRGAIALGFCLSGVGEG